MPHPPPYSLADFDYALPPELIAQYPLTERSASRLLDGRGDVAADRQFTELPALLQPGDLLVFNNTKVLNARLRAVKATGGVVEVLVERLLSPTLALTQLRSSHAPKPGTRIVIAGKHPAEIVGRDERFFQVQLLDLASGNFETLMREEGELPLPPYMQRAASVADTTRYQTVYAQHEGAVAAPTAGLHFDEATLNACRSRGIEMAHVTLHVGAGTFLPVKTEIIAEHKMHRERYVLPQVTVDAITACKARGGRVVAVGTTSVRTLEGCVRECGELREHQGETDIFITPGVKFAVVDMMLTNFHLPKSTLLMLVSAFSGYEHIRSLYAHAINERYRFFSYGDAMLLQRSTA
ncbi:MAG: tRNA preQ1(34) S-adenosylmethionine ribosyltransferase-isomerase QueA [Rhizobacter sp.]|nr:tRNA preQ1(34) S-adenosylmethionine ribosyltransferase-isomerase QueA [Burkholderiales bacterium]